MPRLTLCFFCGKPIYDRVARAQWTTGKVPAHETCLNMFKNLDPEGQWRANRPPTRPVYPYYRGRRLT